LTQFIVFLVSGLVAGAIYSIFASGITLIYSTSGIYCIAFGSFAFMGMVTFFELSEYMPRGVALVLTVLVVAPLSGLVLERVVFRRLAQAPETARLIGSVGLALALPALGLEVVNQLAAHVPSLHLRPVTNTFNVPGIGPVPPVNYHLGNGTLNSDQLIVLVATGIAVGGLWLLITRTRIGLTTRAVVDRSDLASLRGISPTFTSRLSWGLGSALAGLAGVLAGPLFGLDSTAMLQFVVAGSAVVVLGRFRSLPIAVWGGLALGAVTSLVAGYGSQVPGVKTVFVAVPGTQQAVIYIVLLGALLWRGRQRIRVAGITVIERLQVDYLSDLPPWRRWWPWIALSVVLVIWTTGLIPSGHLTAGPVELQLLIQSVGLAIIFLSFVVVVGMLGVASLAQAAIATTGALMAGFIVGNKILGGNFLVAILVGAVAAGLLAMIVALPALRLGGLALALATLALGFIGDTILFQLNGLDNFGQGWPLIRPKLGSLNFANDRTYVILLLVVLGIAIGIVTNFQRSRIGRSIYATRFSAPAASAIGISNRRSILVAFGFTGALAGLGGALLAYGNGNAGPTTWPTLIGLTWLMVAMIQGVRRPGAALLGGLIAGLFPRVLESGFWGLTPKITDPSISTILFGLGAIALAAQPDGALHSISMQNYLRRQRRRLKKAAAQTGATMETLANEPAIDRVAPVPAPVSFARPGVIVSERSNLIELTGLVAGYADAEVLHGVDLTVPEGSIVAVLGPNGTGKSTLCGAIAGLVSVTGGSIVFDGQDITDAPAHRRAKHGVLLAPESRGIFPNLNVEENLSVALPSADDRRLAFERFPQLKDRATLPAANLSGGEQQMLCLAPLLVRPPRLLIADEITLGLAPTIVEGILEHLRELSRAGVTILMVEEKARHVIGLADYCAFLSLGKITKSGPMSEFNEEIFAESYLGTKSSAEIGDVAEAST
jgi:ABC-type branched-subunit amino acid transport system ATPase component/branched-subunit amino acid ABC-type transport system permease component